MSAHDLVVLGAGAAGLAAARAARRAGKRVALVETARPGGDCTHYGCVPSKTLLDLAARVAGAREGRRWGLPTVGEVDLGAAMEHVAEVVRQVEQDESPARLAAEGVDLVHGRARFAAPDVLDVEGRALPAPRVVVAAGAHATVPPLPGLDAVPYLDNRTVFGLRAHPDHLLVLGGGPVGVELAQAFARLGTRTTLLEAGSRILPGEEPEAAAALTRALERDGVTVRTGAQVTRVEPGPVLHLVDGGGGQVVRGSHLLLAVGRTPATDGLGLQAAGVAVGERGEVVTDAWLRTTAEHVFAAGDCTSPLQLTHVADEQGRIAAGNALAAGRLARGRARFDGSGVPWATFTDPEVGRVGMTEAEAFAAYGERARVAVVGLDEVDRARTAARTDGYVKLIAGPRPVASSRLLDRVVGLTAVAPSGGELAALVAVAVQTGMFAGRLAQTVSPYPTYALALRIAAARLFGEFGGRSWRPARPDA